MIRHSSWLGRLDRQDISLGRDALIRALVEYKECKKHEITVVFDGMAIPCMYRQLDRVNGVEIAFSKRNQTADQFICRMVKKEKQRALVVTCDREIITFAESYGASVISSIHFEEKVVRAIDDHGSTKSYNTNRVPPDSKFMTRKKGPSRRLPKNKRRQRIRMEKL